jgi:hypothetical protein
MGRVLPDIPVQRVERLIDWMKTRDFLKKVPTVIAILGVWEVGEGCSPSGRMSAHETGTCISVLTAMK